MLSVVKVQGSDVRMFLSYVRVVEIHILVVLVGSCFGCDASRRRI